MQHVPSQQPRGQVPNNSCQVFQRFQVFAFFHTVHPRVHDLEHTVCHKYECMGACGQGERRHGHILDTIMRLYLMHKIIVTRSRLPAPFPDERRTVEALKIDAQEALRANGGGGRSAGLAGSKSTDGVCTHL